MRCRNHKQKPVWERETYIPPLHIPLTTKEIYKDRIEQAAKFRAMKEAYRNGGRAVVKPVVKPVVMVNDPVAKAAERIAKQRDKAFQKALRSVTG